MKEILHLHRDLIEAAKKQDRKAQKALFDLYSKALYNIGMRLLSNADDAADMTQECFIVVFRKLESYKYEATFGAWAKRIMINRCINHLKRQPLFLDLQENDIPSEETSVSDDVESLMLQLNTSMAELPDGCRVVFTLFYFEGLDHQEIATHLGISVSTSKSQLSRSKQLLRELLTQKIEA